MDVFKTGRNEEGSALVLALILLAVLSIIGFSSVDKTTTELKIIRNERIYQDNFYNAESALQEALSTLELTPKSQLESRSPVWLTRSDTLPNTMDLNDPDELRTATDPNPDNDPVVAATATVADSSKYAVMDNGFAAGASLDMSATSHLYSYTARGLEYPQKARCSLRPGTGCGIENQIKARRRI